MRPAPWTPWHAWLGEFLGLEPGSHRGNAAWRGRRCLWGQSNDSENEELTHYFFIDLLAALRMSLTVKPFFTRGRFLYVLQLGYGWCQATVPTQPRPLIAPCTVTAFSFQRTHSYSTQTAIKRTVKVNVVQLATCERRKSDIREKLCGRGLAVVDVVLIYHSTLIILEPPLGVPVRLEEAMIEL